jgi:hypothetical protein
MDKLLCHKVAGTWEMIEYQQARLLLPAALQPRPQFHWESLRLAHSVAKERIREGLWNSIAQSFSLLTPDECRNLLRSSGYPS